MLDTEATWTVAPTRVATIIADDRPVVRAGLRLALGAADGGSTVGDGPIGAVAQLVEAWRPRVLVVVLRGDDPAPYRAIATAKALRSELSVLALTDEVTATDLREVIVAGADSVVVTTVPLAELRRAVELTARGERVVSPQVAMQLVGSWRPDGSAGGRATLTPRELEVLAQLAEGMTNQQIADQLGVSARTVKTHVQNLLSKLDTPDRTGAVARGFRLGLIR